MKNSNKISYFSFSVRDTLLTLLILSLTSIICLLFSIFKQNIEIFSPHIFLLAVVLIARFTHGYLYGVFASVFSTLAVNYFFTYPYFSFNFSLTGYPVTFLIMLTVSLIVGMLTIRTRHQEQIRMDIEREKIYNNLLRSVSHDIRTPLTSIIGSAAACLDNNEILTDEQKKLLVSDIKNEANWLIRVVENLLSITKISNGQAHLNKDLELAEEITSSAVSKFKHRFPGIEINTSVPLEPLLVPMDAILIEQVLINLFENSVRHGKTTTTINIDVSTANNQAIFQITDNGNGIDKHILPVLFTTYINSEENANDEHKNMGIGLSVCMSIIKAHGGDMTATNLRSGGAQFCFALPLEKMD